MHWIFTFQMFNGTTSARRRGSRGERGSSVEGRCTGPAPARRFSLVTPPSPLTSSSLVPFSQELTEKTEFLLKFISVLSVVIMEDWRNGMLERWNDAPKVSLFHYSSVPVFQVPRHSSLFLFRDSPRSCPGSALRDDVPDSRSVRAASVPRVQSPAECHADPVGLERPCRRALRPCS